MKKVVLIILSVIILTGCSNNKFYLEDKYYSQGTFDEIDKDILNELENNKESFLVMVYTTGCFSCMDFEEVLTEFTSKNNIEVFRINIDDIDNTRLDNVIKYTPSLVIYKEGEIFKYLKADSDRDKQYYKSVSNLVSWLDKYIELNND